MVFLLNDLPIFIDGFSLNIQFIIPDDTVGSHHLSRPEQVRILQRPELGMLIKEGGNVVLNNLAIVKGCFQQRSFQKNDVYELVKQILSHPSKTIIGDISPFFNLF